MKDSTDNNSRNLVDYPESESEDDIIQEESSRSILVKSKEKEINPDPAVKTVVHKLSSKNNKMEVNLPYQLMKKKELEIRNPFSKSVDRTSNTYRGHVEKVYIDKDMFEEQRRNFTNLGYAVNPSKQHLVGTNAGLMHGDDLYINDKDSNSGQKVQKKRKAKGDPADINGFLGPWAGYEEDELLSPMGDEQDHQPKTQNGTDLLKPISDKDIEKLKKERQTNLEKLPVRKRR